MPSCRGMPECFQLTLGRPESSGRVINMKGRRVSANRTLSVIRDDPEIVCRTRALSSRDAVFPMLPLSGLLAWAGRYGLRAGDLIDGFDERDVDHRLSYAQ